MTTHMSACLPRAIRRVAIAMTATASVLLSLCGTALAADKELTLGMGIEPAGLDPTVAAPVAIGQVTGRTFSRGW